MKYSEFKAAVEENYKKYFPFSMCSVKLYSGLGKMIFIDCYLAGNKEEFPNRISQNDMFKIGFCISVQDNFTMDSDMPENMVMEVQSKCYNIKPENPHCCYSSRSLPYRKTKGNTKKVLSTLDKYFRVLKENLVADLYNQNITKEHGMLLVDKIMATMQQMDEIEAIKEKLKTNAK